ncbi:hypothetical protein [Microvirga terrestris]|uniref:Uncharacterized protein n=1 Tax=Microvirga terrestris TaxID=2791024 RepID=A0ABS0HPX0_9HYPH|nr:hypothetical protein [Microvirga terrestris]MBF9195444.1 hypothetical protein [Microvirga terrestris]
MANHSKNDVIDLSKVEIPADQTAKSEEILRSLRVFGWFMFLPYLLMAIVWLQAYFAPGSLPSHEALSWAAKPAGLIAPSVANYVLGLSANGKLNLSTAALASFYGSILCSILSARFLYRGFSMMDINHLIFMRRKRGKKVFDVYAFGLIRAVATVLTMVMFIIVMFKVDLSSERGLRQGRSLAAIPLMIPVFSVMVFQFLFSIKILAGKPRIQTSP